MGRQGTLDKKGRNAIIRRLLTDFATQDRSSFNPDHGPFHLVSSQDVNDFCTDFMASFEGREDALEAKTSVFHLIGAMIHEANPFNQSKVGPFGYLKLMYLLFAVIKKWDLYTALVHNGKSFMMIPGLVSVVKKYESYWKETQSGTSNRLVRHPTMEHINFLRDELDLVNQRIALSRELQTKAEKITKSNDVTNKGASTNNGNASYRAANPSSSQKGTSTRANVSGHRPMTQEVSFSSAYYHYDPNVLFSHFSEDEEEEVVNDDEPVHIFQQPLAMDGNLQTFLQSCREEAVRIGTEKVQAKEVPKRNVPSVSIIKTTESNGKKAPASIPISKRHSGLIDKDSQILQRTEAIRQRVIREESGGASRGHKRPSTDDSARSSSSGPNKASTWTPSFMPDAPDPVLVTIDSDEEESSEKTKNTKKEPNVYDKIRERLQKKLINTQSVVKVNGDVREVFLPVPFSVEEYVDHILSSSYRSQDLVEFHGKQVIVMKHHYSAKNGPKQQHKS